MTNPTTPKALDITELREQILRIIDAHCNLDDAFEPEEMCEYIDKIIDQALAKQKESIKEQLRMIHHDAAKDDDYVKGYNRVCDELNKKLDNL